MIIHSQEYNLNQKEAHTWFYSFSQQHFFTICHEAFISNDERKKEVTPAFEMLYSITPSVLEI